MAVSFPLLTLQYYYLHVSDIPAALGGLCVGARDERALASSVGRPLARQSSIMDSPSMAPPQMLPKPIMAPPPPLPAQLNVLLGTSPGGFESSTANPGEEKPLPPQPGQEEFYRRPDNWPGRGYLVKYVGESIHRKQETPFNIRHDILIEKRVIGRILGKGGRDLEGLQLSTGASVFIIDKYPPPGEGEDHRLLVLIGRPDQVRSCKHKLDAVLERAREELPPLPPPLTSGWRPVPSVGSVDECDSGDGKLWGEKTGAGWMEFGGDRKRSREDADYVAASTSNLFNGSVVPAKPTVGYADRKVRAREVHEARCSGGSRSDDGQSQADLDASGYDKEGYGQRSVGPDPYYGLPHMPPPVPGRSTYVQVGAGIIRPPGERGNAPPPRKVGNCFDWQRGVCSRGENCRFSHGGPFDGS